MWLLKVDAAGDVDWSRKYDATEVDFGFSVVQLGDGGFALSGSIDGLGSIGRDALLLRVDQAGNIPNCPVDSDNPVVVEPDGVSEDDSSVSDDVYQLTVHDSNSSPVNTETRPDPICGELSERLNINYETGAPGSYFTLTGLYFPAESVIEISVNGLNLGSVNSDANGDLVFLILTPGADEGGYVVKAQAGMEMATSIFRLDNSQPLRPQEGDGVVFNVPPGISLTRRGLLPTIISD